MQNEESEDRRGCENASNASESTDGFVSLRFTPDSRRRKEQRKKREKKKMKRWGGGGGGGGGKLTNRS